MEKSNFYSISSLSFILLAVVFVWDSGLMAWLGAFAALYSGACYGWHREALKEEMSEDYNGRT